MNLVCYAFCVLAIFLFCFGYHYMDLAFNAKYGTVDVGNGLSDVGLHMAGLVMLFLSMIMFVLAVMANDYYR